MVRWGAGVATVLLRALAAVALTTVAAVRTGGGRAAAGAEGAAEAPGAAPADGAAPGAAPADGAATGAQDAAPAEAAGDLAPREAAPAGPALPPVPEGQEPWTPAEVAEVRAELTTDADRLRHEVETAESTIADLVRDSGGGSGDDQADAGTKTAEIEHELGLANHARTLLDQTRHALARLDAGHFGLCATCGRPIAKARLQAFPRATLCLACKQAEERR